MDKIIFGKTGLLMSRIAFGGIPIMRLAKEDAVRIIRKSIELGINLIDTAAGFNAGECIECGECIKRCPYSLDIPFLLKETIKFWDEYKSSH